MRLLFCLPTSALSGGVKVIFEMANRLVALGEHVDVFSFAGPPHWYRLTATMLDVHDIDAIDLAPYDFVIVSNAFLVPMVLPRLGGSRCILFAQDYESFHHADGTSYAAFMSDCPTFTEIYQLPVPIIAISRAVQHLILERSGRESFYCGVGIDKAIFRPRPRKAPTGRRRVLMVGNYLMPYKGMKDGFEALRLLSGDVPVQLVLVTQETRNRALLSGLPFPVEVHVCPTEPLMPDIIASCDVYCCASWYEGLGLPALEAFCCGVPVVSTRTWGVSDYGVDGVNILLAEPADPRSLYRALRRLLLDEALAETLRQAAFKTMERTYDWDASAATFRSALRDIDRAGRPVGEVDARAMGALLERLEAEGNLTPIAVFRRFQALAAELADLLPRLTRQTPPAPSNVRALTRLRDELRGYVTNEKAEYFSAFKSQYDLCQVILSLAGHRQFAEYVGMILAARQQRGRGTPPSFSEIRYPDQQSGDGGMARTPVRVE